MFPTYVQDITVHQNSYLEQLITLLILVSEATVNALFALSWKYHDIKDSFEWI